MNSTNPGLIVLVSNTHPETRHSDTISSLSLKKHFKHHQQNVSFAHSQIPESQTPKTHKAAQRALQSAKRNGSLPTVDPLKVYISNFHTKNLSVLLFVRNYTDNGKLLLIFLTFLLLSIVLNMKYAKEAIHYSYL